jgi:hypothetical protein
LDLDHLQDGADAAEHGAYFSQTLTVLTILVGSSGDRRRA